MLLVYMKLQFGCRSVWSMLSVYRCKNFMVTLNIQCGYLSCMFVFSPLNRMHKMCRKSSKKCKGLSDGGNIVHQSAEHDILIAGTTHYRLLTHTPHLLSQHPLLWKYPTHSIRAFSFKSIGEVKVSVGVRVCHSAANERTFAKHSNHLLFAEYQYTVLVMYILQILASLVVLSGSILDMREVNNLPVNTTCPPGTAYVQHNCTCVRKRDRIILCRQHDGEFEVGVLIGYCMTMNSKRSEVVVGSCPFITQTYGNTHIHVPNKSAQLDGAVCNFTHRTGQLCGQCVNGTSPPVYSYYPQCVKCPAGTNNWAKYLAVSLLPTTLFFLATVILRFRATSPNLNGFILLCQIVTSPVILRRCGSQFYMHRHTPEYLHVRVVGEVYLSYASIWNLDFFRLVYPPFCLHPNTTTLQVLSLDYIIAAYPLVLIILTYILVTLHYYNCRLVVCLWRPFLRCCIRFKRQCDIRNSLVDVFATFLLLSYVKFLSVSFDILTPSLVWNMTWTRQPTVLYYDGSVEYFSREHLPYAILAIIVLLVFTLLPIALLCLYPCHCFQRLLNVCHLRYQPLRTFMDAFQGCYKDGTNGTRDCRFFAAVYLITRVAVHLSLVFTLVLYNTSVFITLLLIVILLLSGFQPYKKQFYNVLDTFFLVSAVSFMSSAWILQDFNTKLIEIGDRVIFLSLAPIPVVYPLCVVLYYVWKKSRRLQSATEWIRACFSRSESYQSVEESLPRRVIMDEAAALLKRKRHLLS